MSTRRSGVYLVLALIIPLTLIAGVWMGVMMGHIYSGTPQTLTSVTVTDTTTLVTGGSSSSSSMIQYCFTIPQGTNGDCASVVVKWVNSANSSVHVMIYSFTLPTIANALIQAHNRGVDVKIVVDNTEHNVQGSQYQTLLAANIPIKIATGVQLMHNKVAIIDSHIILTGSFNWTGNAENNNDENLVVLDNANWAAAYENTFQIVYGSGQ